MMIAEVEMSLRQLVQLYWNPKNFKKCCMLSVVAVLVTYL